MTGRQRVVTAIVAVAVHLVLLGPLVFERSMLVDGFAVEAREILGGAKPYADEDFEYPPLSLPLFLAPAKVSSENLEQEPRVSLNPDLGPDYETSFAIEMLLFDLMIVLLIALALQRGRDEVWAALGVYTVGVVALSNLGPLPDSAIGDDGALALARFDLAPAALVLAALIAREAARSAMWSALLGTATAVKAFPLLLYPPMLRDEKRLVRVAVATAIPLLVAAGIVLFSGDEFGSAIGYHTGRHLQLETIAANPFLIGHLLGAVGAGTSIGGGSYNLDASGASAARAISLIALLGLYALVAWRAWERRTPPFAAATALLAIAVVLAPVLSPQFLLWLLPVSAAAYGLRAQNLVLLAAILITQLLLHYYGGLIELTTRAVLTLTLRNILLLVYLALVLAPILRPGLAPQPSEAKPAPAA